MTMQHSELGASISHRWMACPGSVRMSRGTDNYDNIHSLTGTAAHALAEMCLENGRAQPHDFIGTELALEPNTLGLDTIEVTDDMADAVKVYVDYCRGLMAEPGAQWWIEQQFNLAELNPPADMFGTSDFPCYKPELRELEVVDYKNGSGVVVEVKNNKQLRYYALGALLALGTGLDIDTIKMTIVQPRVGHVDGPIRSETISLHDLLAFSAELMDAAEATQAPDAPLVAGRHCRFCPAAPTCPAQRDQAQALAQVTFADMPVSTPPAPTELPPDVFADILGKLHILEDWSRAMRAHAMRLVESGEEVPGFKLVAKRATRKWVDEDIVRRHLFEQHGLTAEQYNVEKLKSPAQIEKLVGKKNVPDDLYEKVSSGYNLVPEHDPRPAVALSPADVFPALPRGDDA